MHDSQHWGFGLYIHWPFCQSKCPYCDFNSHVTSIGDQRRWLHAYEAEIDRLANQTAGRLLTSIYFGGGTPSLMDPELVHGILERIWLHWKAAPNPEITLEANPGSVESARFAGFRAAGVNRVSLGIQALNDVDLKQLGRLHSVKDARKAFDIARAHFNRVSFDLIYARQDQDLSAWRRELSDAITMATDHLSLYQLTIEPDTAFGERFARGRLRGLPDEDRAVAMYEATQEICDAANISAYEVSNHSRPGAEGQHNLVYWRGGDYIGIGPGAHGRLTLDGVRWATECPKLPAEWLQQVEARQPGEYSRIQLSATERAEEYLLMSMRLAEGADLSRIAAILGYPPNVTALVDLQEMGMIVVSDMRVTATLRGRLVLNSVIEQMSAALIWRHKLKLSVD